MLLNEILTQDELQDCASIRGVDGLGLLHLCFDHHSESDPDVVFDKNQIFFSFLLNFAFSTTLAK